MRSPIASPIASPIMSSIAVFTPISESGAPPPDDGSIGASLVASLAVPTAAAGASVAVRGEVARSLPSPLLTSAARVRVSGGLAASLPVPELAAQAATSNPAVTGNLDAALPVPTLTATASVEVVGQVAALLSPPTIAASAEVVDAGGVPTDGPGAVFVPAAAADWSALSLPAPLVQHNCQDVSGSLAPAFGVDAPLAAVGSGHLYEQVVAGWSRKFVGLTLNAVNQAFMYTGSLLDIGASGEPFAWLLYASAQHSTAQSRPLIRFSTNAVGLLLRSDGRLNVTWSGGSGDTSGPVHSGIAVVRPWLFYRRTGPSAVGAFTDIRAFTGFHSNTANAGGSKGIGTEAGSALDARVGLSAFWRGTAANAIAQASTLATLGW